MPFTNKSSPFTEPPCAPTQKTLKEKGAALNYIEAHEAAHDLRELMVQLSNRGIDTLHVIDPTDTYAKQRLQKGALHQGIELIWYDNPLFLNTPADNRPFFNPEKKSFIKPPSISINVSNAIS